MMIVPPFPEFENAEITRNNTTNNTMIAKGDNPSDRSRLVRPVP